MAELVNVLRMTPSLTPFAILNAVHGCDLTVFEIGSANLDGIVDEILAQRKLNMEVTR